MKERMLVVSQAQAGQPLAKVLRARLAWSWSEVQQAVAAGRVRINGSVCRNPAHRLSRGLRLSVAGAPQPVQQPRKRQPPPSKPRYQGPTPVIRYADGQVVVVDKPAGLTTMRHAEEAAEFGARARRFLPATLADWLPELLAPAAKGKPLLAVHRLDKETSGLV